MCIFDGDYRFKGSPTYGISCDVYSLYVRHCERGYKVNLAISFIKVGRKMKIVNENLELIDYEEKKDEIKDTYEDIHNYKLIAKIAIIDLIYDINKNTCHKMNGIIILTQLIVLATSIICQFLFNEFKLVISVAGTIGSLILMCLVIINIKLSNKALVTTRKQQNIIEECIDKLSRKK